MTGGTPVPPRHVMTRSLRRDDELDAAALALASSDHSDVLRVEAERARCVRCACGALAPLALAATDVAVGVSDDVDTLHTLRRQRSERGTRTRQHVGRLLRE